MFERLIFCLLCACVMLDASAQYNPETDTYTLQDSDVVVENGVILSCSTNADDWGTGNLIIPEELDGQVVKAILDVDYGGYALKGVFESKGIEGVLFPTTLVHIGMRAFEKNEIKVLVLPNTVNYIGEGAFYQNLIEKLVLPENIDTIRQATFDYSKIKEVKIPKSLKCFTGRGGFYTSDSLRKVVFEEGSQLDYVGLSVFSKCHVLEEFYLPNPVEKEGYTFLKWTCGGKTVEKFDKTLREPYIAHFFEEGKVYTIKGTVSSPDLKGVSIAFDGDTAGVVEIGDNGEFSMQLAAGQSIVLTPERTGAVFVPEKKTLDDVLSDQFNISFSEEEKTGFDDFEIVVSVSPNPTEGLLTISAEETIKSVFVFSQTGKLLFTEKADALNHTLDLSLYADGTYYIQIKTLNNLYKQVVSKK